MRQWLIGRLHSSIKAVDFDQPEAAPIRSGAVFAVLSIQTARLQPLTVGLHDDAPRDCIASGTKKDYEENKDDLQGGTESGTMGLSATLMHSTVFRGDFRLRRIVEFVPPL
jgi:hypothetical protein